MKITYYPQATSIVVEDVNLRPGSPAAAAVIRRPPCGGHHNESNSHFPRWTIMVTHLYVIITHQPLYTGEPSDRWLYSIDRDLLQSPQVAIPRTGGGGDKSMWLVILIIAVGMVILGGVMTAQIILLK